MEIYWCHYQLFLKHGVFIDYFDQALGSMLFPTEFLKNEVMAFYFRAFYGSHYCSSERIGDFNRALIKIFKGFQVVQNRFNSNTSTVKFSFAISTYIHKKKLFGFLYSS